MSGWHRRQPPRLRIVGARPPRRRARRWTLGPWRKVAVLAVLAAGVVGVQVSGVLSSSGSGGCRVAWVTDGDTVRAWCPGRGLESVRLTGFDTPEVFSPKCPSEWAKGTIATGALAWHVLMAGEAALVLSGRDRYGRALGRLNLDGRNVADLMIAEGHARRYDGGRRQGWCF